MGECTVHDDKLIVLIILISFLSTTFLYAQIETKSVADIARENGKAVVLITTLKKDTERVCLGSGFIVDPEGVIITNYHVIEGAYQASIKTLTGEIYDDILIIDTDERRDIAVIKIKSFGLPVVRLGNSDNVKVGEQVIAIGNPEGLENTVTEGIISAIRDSGSGYMLHQISVPISPGSSGSPVFNIYGEVIGIATSSLLKGQNLNFSLPINYARGLISKEIKCSLEEFSRQTNLARFPPLVNEHGIKFIPDKVRDVMISGIDNRKSRSDIQFEIFRYFHFPASDSVHNVFIFRLFSNVSMCDVFIQFYKVENGIPINIAKELNTLTYFANTSSSNDEYFYSVGYPLPPGNYLLAMAITTINLNRIGLQYYEFVAPAYNIPHLDTTPIFLTKYIAKMDTAETRTFVHANYFTYSILRIAPYLDNIIGWGEDLDIFYYVMGAETDRNMQYDIYTKFSVFRDNEIVINYAPGKFDSPLVSIPLKLEATFSRGRTQQLGRGYYILKIEIRDNVSMKSVNKYVNFIIR